MKNNLIPYGTFYKNKNVHLDANQHEHFIINLNLLLFY